MLSVIVPAHRADPAFERCLDALAPAAAAGCPIIVVDDGSPDAAVSRRARELGFQSCRHDTSRGPAAARNLGAGTATTPLLLFIDADVVVQPDTASLVRAFFDTHPDVAALFGSYDTTPSAPQLVSQFKNLTHHYTHQQAREDAFTFWAGCGAVRRDVFLALGGFSSRFGRPCIEDIEFGYRLRQSGHRIALVKNLQVSHLKRWTLGQLVRTDVFDRGVPWVELILEHPDATAGDLNLSSRARLALVLTWLSLGAALVSAVWPPALIASAVGVALVIVLGHSYFSWLARVRGLWFAARCVPLHLLYQLYSGVAVLIGVARHVTRGAPARTGGQTPAVGGAGAAARTVGASFAALASGEIVARLIGFIVTLYLARTVGTAGFGDLEVGLAVFSYLQLFVDGGFDAIAVRSVSRNPGERPRFAANVLGIRIVMAVTVVLAVVAATRAGIGTPSVRDVVWRYALAVLPLAFSLNWAFQAEQRMRAVAARNVITQVCYAGLVVVLIHRPQDAPIVPLAYVAAIAVGVASLGAWYVRRFGIPGLSVQRTFIATVVPQAWPIAVSGVLRAVSYNFDILILGFLFPTLGVGIYAAAYRLITLPLLGYATLSTALFPMLVRLRGHELRRAALGVGMVVAGSSVPVAFAFGHWATPLLAATAGEAFTPGADVLGLLAWSIPLTATAGIFRQLLLASDRQRQDLAVVVTAGVVNASLNLLLIPRAGLNGAAMATIVGEGVVLVAAAALVIRARMTHDS